MKRILTVFCYLGLATAGFAQEQEVELTPLESLEQKTQTIEESLKKMQKFKVSGYVQTQYQWGEQDASLKVGAGNSDPEESFDRLGIRRGRIKFTYETGIASGVFQLDMTEKGVGLKDAYLGVKDPWVGTSSLKAGVFDRPFGNEIGYSSSRRESPERSTIFQTLFPEERDLGAMLVLQAPKTSPLNFLKLEAGLFAGNGIKIETDNRRDFIGHLSADKKIGSNFQLAGGVSYYNGGVYQGTDSVYSMTNNAFELDDVDNKGEFAKREYCGFDLQVKATSALGLTHLRAEYLFGEQPGSASNNKSPNAAALPSTHTYRRNFNGGYVIFIQELGKLPLSAVVKYDWYDPNTKITKNDIGLNGTTSADLSQNTLGFGMLWRVNNNIRLQAYYEINSNETSQNLPAFVEDVKNDVFTLRLQYKF